MKLFNLNSEKELSEVSPVAFKLEKDIQELVEKNIENIFGYKFIASEFTVGKYRIDTLCFNEEENSFVIVEYKKGNSYSVIDQGYTYLQLMLNNKSDFLLKLSQYFNKVLDVRDVDWSQSRIMFISPTFNSFQKDSVNFKNLPFELWEIKHFSNGTIILDQHLSNSKESLKSLPVAGNQSKDSVEKVSREVKVVDVDDHIEKCNPNIKEKWGELKEMLLELDGVDISAIPRYVTLDYNHRKVCYFHFGKSGFHIDLRRANINADGKKSKNFFDLDDPKKLAIIDSWVYKSGATGGKYRIPVKANTDLNYVFFLIKQNYNQITGS